MSSARDDTHDAYKCACIPMRLHSYAHAHMQINAFASTVHECLLIASMCERVHACAHKTETAQAHMDHKSLRRRFRSDARYFQHTLGRDTGAAPTYLDKRPSGDARARAAQHAPDLRARRAATCNGCHALCTVQHATDNMQRTTCNGQHATCNGQHATDNMQRTTCNGQHATCNMQHATDNMQRTTCNGHHATDNMQRTPCNGHYATDTMQQTTCTMQRAAYDRLLGPKCARTVPRGC
jgi:hypothetical protein